MARMLWGVAVMLALGLGGCLEQLCRRHWLAATETAVFHQRAQRLFI
jgi:hypothetical protein